MRAAALALTALSLTALAALGRTRKAGRGHAAAGGANVLSRQRGTTMTVVLVVLGAIARAILDGLALAAGSVVGFALACARRRTASSRAGLGAGALLSKSKFGHFIIEKIFYQ